MRNRVCEACAVLLLLSAPAWAQSGGTIELGAYGGITDFDNTLNLDAAIGGGARVGVFVVRGLAVEVDLTRSSKSGVKHKPLRVSLAYNVPAGPSAQVIVGLGYLKNEYGGSVDVSEDGFSGFVGLRARLASAVALRFGGVLDYVGHPANQSNANDAPYNGNVALQLGLSVLLNPFRRGAT